MKQFYEKQIGRRFDLWYKEKSDSWGKIGWEFSLHSGLTSMNMPCKGYKFKGTFVVKSINY